MAPVDCIHVEVVYSPRAQVLECVTLHLPPQSTVAQALQRVLDLRPEKSGAAPNVAPALWSVLSDVQAWPQLAVGVWGRSKALTTILREGDRLEVYRPLTVDPKEARRQRYAQHRTTAQGRRKARAA
jgi:putative ubiquitin-RnfH superfamily antitoxin RatB of RatAB toxin-antitoxin module